MGSDLPRNSSDYNRKTFEQNSSPPLCVCVEILTKIATNLLSDFR